MHRNVHRGLLRQCLQRLSQSVHLRQHLRRRIEPTAPSAAGGRRSPNPVLIVSSAVKGPRPVPASIALPNTKLDVDSSAGIFGRGRATTFVLRREWDMKARVGRLASLVSLAVILVFNFLVQASTGAPASTSEVAPNPVNMVDCNGLSPAFKATKSNMKSLCTDPVTRGDYGSSRFYDNGKYIGHDEPSVKFVSAATGSGNHMTFLMQLAVDPAAAPTPNGSVTKSAELSIAPWFGLPLCDPKSYPQQPCTPDSDSKTRLGSKTDAGSAFMELQFYPPAFGPFKDAFSCDQTRYPVPLTIDTLSYPFNFNSCHNNATERRHFAH